VNIQIQLPGVRLGPVEADGVIQGKGLYRVSNIVDLTNLSSVETGWPYGVHDRAKFICRSSSVWALRMSVTTAIGRRVWHIKDRPVLADATGPFGSPISDSTRTQIVEGVTEVLTVIYAPAGALDAALEVAAEKQAARLCAFSGASGTRTCIIG